MFRIPPLLASLLALAAAACGHNETVPASAHWTVDVTAAWQTPPGQGGGNPLDYRAIVFNSNDYQAFLSFNPEVDDSLVPEVLQRHFRHADIYWKTTEGVVAIHVPHAMNQGVRLRFLQGKAGQLRLMVAADKYRLQIDGAADGECRTGDVIGFCRKEIEIEKPLRLEIDATVAGSKR